MRKNIVFGGQGFIGQTLCRELLNAGESVYSIDKNIWNIEFDQKLWKSNRFFSVIEDINSLSGEQFDALQNYSDGNTTVWHLAANSDIAKGVDNIDVDLNDTLLTTVNIIKLMERLCLSDIIFASSSAVYGNMVDIVDETSVTKPVSNYGAMKLASEAVITAFQNKFRGECLIARFPNVIGTPATHGVILDLIKKLSVSKVQLEVLGNGKQNKNYLYVDDLISALLHLRGYAEPNSCEIYNIGCNGPNVYVSEIAEAVRNATYPNASISYQNSETGWVGDVPVINLGLDKLKSTGWKNMFTGHEAVDKTIAGILKSYG